MKVPVMDAQMREIRGKGGARQTRRDGRVPIVVYARGLDSKHLSIDAKEFDTLILKKHRKFTMKGDGIDETLCVIQDLQRHPVSMKVIHADFIAVTPETVLITKLPVALTGEPVGIKEGGQVRQLLHYVQVECKVELLPPVYEVDTTECHASTTLLVRDLPVGEMKILNDSHLAVMQVTKPRGDEDEEEGAEGATDAPEADAEETSEESK
jgi:large subunit ribosomal protein L25